MNVHLATQNLFTFIAAVFRPACFPYNHQYNQSLISSKEVIRVTSTVRILNQEPMGTTSVLSHRAGFLDIGSAALPAFCLNLRLPQVPPDPCYLPCDLVILPPLCSLSFVQRVPPP